MLRTTSKRWLDLEPNEEPIPTEKQRELAQLVYDHIDDEDTREEWLNYIKVATKDEVNDILLSFIV
jgi:hypothetical protein